MKKKLDILKWLLPLVVLLATACGHDDLVLPDEYQEEPPTPYVEIRIAVPLANPYGTRANPMGGEEGNGRERGVLNEDKVHDINVFFYRDGDGMNGNDTTTIGYHFYYNIQNKEDALNTKVDSISEEDTYFGARYYTFKFKYWKGDGNISETNGMKFLAVANAGDMGQNIKTLGQLRNYGLDDNTWQNTYDAFSQDASTKDYFLMSTAYNEENTSGQRVGNNTIQEGSNGEYSGTTTLQRMYARLDLWYNKSANAITTVSGNNEKVTELRYAVENATSNKVYITNVLPVNVMQKPSFLFKKVTKEITLFDKSGLSAALDANNYLWGGKESPTVNSSNDRPRNYVIERHTLDKNSSGTGELNTWYGNSMASQVKTDITSVEKGKLSGYYHGAPASESNPDYGCNQIAIISYANENTHPTDCFHSNYLTGMAFRAVYVPGNIYKDFSENTTKDENGNDKVTYELDPVADNESIGDTIYRYSPTAAALEEAKSLYFTDRDKAEDYAKKNPGDMAVITSYKAEKHTLSDGSQKWGFICYYNLWLRHYNDVDDVDSKTDPHEHLPMEYATVRNNIYRVSVDFSGPGDPEPTMREPDTMKARIYVRKWNYREEDEIIF
ncbi:MAG: fimbria major subunit [Muribaculaceae bacterium]|nr:fimbria major subunit [Muribaculaceae bacterium]